MIDWKFVILSILQAIHAEYRVDAILDLEVTTEGITTGTGTLCKRFRAVE